MSANRLSKGSLGEELINLSLALQAAEGAL